MLTIVGKPKGKRPLRRLRHGCEDNIRINLRKYPRPKNIL
jgi:hypothetical protein